MKRPLLLPLLIMAVLSSGCVTGTPRPLERSVVHLISAQGNTISVDAEVALTAIDQERGLMGRKSLKPSEGMLFVFRESATLSFWMKDTTIPLDILFFDEVGRVLSWTTMQPCDAASSQENRCPLYSSRLPARYALEVTAGFVQSHHIDDTWKLKLQEWR